MFPTHTAISGMKQFAFPSYSNNMRLVRSCNCSESKLWILQRIEY